MEKQTRHERRHDTPKKTIYVSAEDQKILDANPQLVASRLFSQALHLWRFNRSSFLAGHGLPDPVDRRVHRRRLG